MRGTSTVLSILQKSFLNVSDDGVLQVSLSWTSSIIMVYTKMQYFGNLMFPSSGMSKICLSSRVYILFDFIVNVQWLKLALFKGPLRGSSCLRHRGNRSSFPNIEFLYKPGKWISPRLVKLVHHQDQTMT